MFASLGGTGASLSQALPGGMEGPAAFCASPVPPSEQNGGEMGKEELTMVNKIKAFNN